VSARPADAEFAAQIRANFGEATYDALQHFNDTGAMRELAGQLSNTLASTPTPLSADQADQLVEILAKQQSHARWTRERRSARAQFRRGLRPSPGVALGAPTGGAAPVLSRLALVRSSIPSSRRAADGDDLSATAGHIAASVPNYRSSPAIDRVVHRNFFE